MYNAVIIALIIAVFTALIWYYERKTVDLEVRLHSALDRIEELVDVSNQPPFNLELDPVAAEAFRLGSFDKPEGWTQEQYEEWGVIDSGIAHDGSFTRQEIEHWN